MSGVNLNMRPSELLSVCGTIDPDATAAGVATSDYVSLGDMDRLLAILSVGAMETGATVDAKLVQATDSSGTGKKDITGKAATQLTEAGSDDDKQVLFEVMSEDLDTENSFFFVALEVTVAVDAVDLGAVLLGYGYKYGPASDGNLASVDEIVN